jgi:hypothetical protein
MAKSEDTSITPIGIRSALASTLKKSVADYEKYLLDLRQKETSVKNKINGHPTGASPMRKDEAMGYGPSSPQTNQLAGTSSGSGMAMAEAQYKGPERRSMVGVQRGTGEAVSIPARHLARMAASKKPTGNLITVTMRDGRTVQHPADRLHELNKAEVVKAEGLSKQQLSLALDPPKQEPVKPAAPKAQPAPSPIPKQQSQGNLISRSTGKLLPNEDQKTKIKAQLAQEKFHASPVGRALADYKAASPVHHDLPDMTEHAEQLTPEGAVPLTRIKVKGTAHQNVDWDAIVNELSQAKAAGNQFHIPSIVGKQPAKRPGIFGRPSFHDIYRNRMASGAAALGLNRPATPPAPKGPGLLDRFRAAYRGFQMGKAELEKGLLTDLGAKARGPLAAIKLMTTVATSPVPHVGHPTKHFTSNVARADHASRRSPIMSKTLTKAQAPAMGAKPPSGVTPGAPKMPKPAVPKVGGAPGGGVPGAAPKVGAAPKMPKTTIPATGQPTMGKAEPAVAEATKLRYTPESAMATVKTKFGHLTPQQHLEQARKHLAAHSKNSNPDHIHFANAHTMHSMSMAQVAKGEAGALSGAGSTMGAPMSMGEKKGCKGGCNMSWSTNGMACTNCGKKASVKKGEGDPSKAKLDGMIKPSDGGTLPGDKKVKDVSGKQTEGTGAITEVKKLNKAAIPPVHPGAKKVPMPGMTGGSRLSQMHAAYKGHAAQEVQNTMGFGGPAKGTAAPQAWGRRTAPREAPPAPAGLGLGKSDIKPGSTIAIQSLVHGKPSAPAPHNPSLPFGGQSFSLQPVKPGMPAPTSPASAQAQTSMAPKGGVLDRFKTAWKGGAAKAAASMPMGKGESKAPKCKECGKSYVEGMNTYPGYCSKKCSDTEDTRLAREHFDEVNERLGKGEESKRRLWPAKTIVRVKRSGDKEEWHGRYHGPAPDSAGKPDYHRVNRLTGGQFHLIHQKDIRGPKEEGDPKKKSEAPIDKTVIVQALGETLKKAVGEHLDTLRKNGELCKRCQDAPIHKGELCKGCADNKAVRKHQGNCRSEPPVIFEPRS